MTGFTRVLVASHGSSGARAAEAVAVESCASGGCIVHLLVVPDLWRGMMGDDWLNNASTRDAFGRHLERELAREAQQHVDRLRAAARAAGLDYDGTVVVGDPTRCLMQMAARLAPDLVVIGSRRPEGAAGLRSRIDLAGLLRGLGRTLMVVPHPR